MNEEHSNRSAQRESSTAAYSNLKLTADRRDAVAQYNYRICLQNGEGVSKDLKGAAHYFKVAADQGIAAAQFNYEICLHQGEGVSKKLKAAAYYRVFHRVLASRDGE
jgi:TPR repeat protein